MILIEINSKVLLIILFIVVMFICFLVVKNYLTDKQIVEKATVIGEMYFIDNYGVEVEFVDSQVMASSITTRVVLYGYIVGKEEDKIKISLDYRDFEVTGTGIPLDLKKIGE